ncbi:SNF2-related protein [Corynebacterium callunae]|uniref:DNA/RNA helicase, superfamily II, SNF2 family protein n=1 Tax=Corynebacterium callunae DSM 20147 TaxID=1121353 RepID=M1UYL6_9CORY|nr:SNF2-related protein [Corynebacterium callunae]AGG66643.1 DNA/RNA helicase, superfamily II, SNF2 family protein [Corynebacterium callunae DSM 20147]
MSNEVPLTDYQAKFFAHELERSYANDHVGKLAGLLFDAQVEPKPHQIDAALFALQTPFLPGVILADEVGLGKTIEAGIVISQYWAERKRRILIVAPSSLRQQWKQELFEKFLIPAELLDSTSKVRLLGKSSAIPSEVLICSYEFLQRNEIELMRSWDLVVADEAHRLRSYWNGRAKVAGAFADVVRNASKTILLTATPLQNKLEELYGLVSVFDPDYFHSLEAFRERYIKNRDLQGDDDLVERVATISKRTLRRDAEKYIQFTQRMPITIEFEPSDEEKRLYDLVNDYLQRDDLYAFAASQRHLSALILRKRLGSSTFAVASTLENIASRLAEELQVGQRRDGRGVLVFDDDLTTEELEEADSASQDRTANETWSDNQLRDGIQAEIEELRGFAHLARSIRVNQKAVHLGDALDRGFAKLREIGAPEKAIIFTDSTKTQEYIAQTLREAGRSDGLVLFNGQNNSPAATAIYQDWLMKNKDSDIVTGIPASDRRKALVDYFRDNGSIMIATEAAAEGINLQFCSMLVNYDLPWNPQRVEQRIGRIHRFGQKHNVVVVNFSNKGNIAEQRILELLEGKFKLFDSVFGASDEVLGAIEDGFDFERQISRILDQCTTAEQIDAAFQILEEQYSTEITEEMAKAKTKVFDNLDPHVQDRLKSYDEQSGEVLNKFERLLVAVTRYKLRDHATFHGDGRTFELNSSPVADAPLGRYFFKSAPIEGAHQYRYSSALAKHAVTSAIEAPTPPAELILSLSQSPRVPAAIREFEGASGNVVVKKITFDMKAKNDDVSESYILAAGFADDGRRLDAEHVTDLMELVVTEQNQVTAAGDEELLEAALDQQRSQLEREVQSRNTRYYNQQEEILERSIQDRKAEKDAKIREYEAKRKEHRKLSRQADDPMEELRHKKQARKWRERVEEEEEAYMRERDRLTDEVDDMLVLIEQSLNGTQRIDDLFSIRWKITA